MRGIIQIPKYIESGLPGNLFVYLSEVCKKKTTQTRIVSRDYLDSMVEKEVIEFIGKISCRLLTYNSLTDYHNVSLRLYYRVLGSYK